jgi:hypothetical protein
MLSRERETVLHEEVVLHFHNSSAIACVVDDDFFQDAFVNGSLSFVVEAFVMVKVAGFDEFGVGGDVDFDGGVSSEVACSFDFFFGEGGVDEVSGGIVEVEGVHCRREELSEGSVFFHLSEDFVYFFVPLFFSVLLVEDAVGFVLQSYTSETKVTSSHIYTIETMRTVLSIIHYRITMLHGSRLTSSITVIGISSSIPYAIIHFTTSYISSI